jgi:hypothetical protein
LHQVPQLPNVFLKIFPRASHFYPIYFSQREILNFNNGQRCYGKTLIILVKIYGQQWTYPCWYLYGVSILFLNHNSKSPCSLDLELPIEPNRTNSTHLYRSRACHDIWETSCPWKQSHIYDIDIKIWTEVQHIKQKIWAPSYKHFWHHFSSYRMYRNVNQTTKLMSWVNKRVLVFSSYHILGWDWKNKTVSL